MLFAEHAYILAGKLPDFLCRKSHTAPSLHLRQIIGYLLCLALIQLRAVRIQHHAAGFLAGQHQLNIVLCLDIKLSILPRQIDMQLALFLLRHLLRIRHFAIQGQIDKLIVDLLPLHIFQINVGIVHLLVCALRIIGIILYDLTIADLNDTIGEKLCNGFFMRN